MPLIAEQGVSNIALPFNAHFTAAQGDRTSATGALDMKGFGVNGTHVNGHEYPKLDVEPLIRDKPAWTPRKKIKVVTVGAGFSGLMFAHKLQHQYPEVGAMIDHKIFEARHDVGGTWLVNTYPGIQCDVPAHIYVRGQALWYFP